MSGMNIRDSEAPEGREQSVRHRARVVKIGAEPLLYIEGIGEVRFAYRAVKKKPGEPRATIVIGDQVECRLTRATPPKAVSVRLLRNGPPPQTGVEAPGLPPPPPPPSHTRRQQQRPQGTQVEVSRSSTIDTSSTENSMLDRCSSLDSGEAVVTYAPPVQMQVQPSPSMNVAYDSGAISTQPPREYQPPPPTYSQHHQHTHHFRHDPYAYNTEGMGGQQAHAPIPVARPLPSPVTPPAAPTQSLSPHSLTHPQVMQPHVQQHHYGAQYAAATYVQQAPPMQPTLLPIAQPVTQQMPAEMHPPPPPPPVVPTAPMNISPPPQPAPSLLSALQENVHQQQQAKLAAGIDAEIDSFLRTVGAAGQKKDGENVRVEDIAEFIAAQREYQASCAAQHPVQRGRDALPSDFAKKGPRRVHSLPPPSRDIAV